MNRNNRNNKDQEVNRSAISQLILMKLWNPAQWWKVPETWLDSVYCWMAAFIQCFDAIDVTPSIGGGTCIFVKSYLHVKPIKVSSSAIADFNMETVCLDIFSPVVKYRLFVCCIPPYPLTMALKAQNI